MFAKFFNYDNPFWQFMARAWDLMILNLICVLLCLPVITAGAALTALYYVTLKMAEDRESRIYRSFFKAFRENLLQAFAIEGILAAAGAAIVLNIRYFILGDQGFQGLAVMEAGAGNMLLYAMMIAAILFYLMLCLYVFAVQARFSNPVLRTIGNSLFMAVRHLPLTILMLAADALFIYIAGSFVPWLAFWLISGTAYINSLFLCRIFRKYIPGTENEKVKTR